jgi:hypothetical protein
MNSKGDPSDTSGIHTMQQRELNEKSSVMPKREGSWGCAVARIRKTAKTLPRHRVLLMGNPGCRIRLGSRGLRQRCGGRNGSHRQTANVE